jgi:osmotically-inducible protein OsmY
MLVLAAAGALAAYLYFARRGLQRARQPYLLTDHALAKAVERRLSGILADPEAVRVSAHEGVLTLRGSVERARLDGCLRAALSVPGVKSVLNRLEAEGMPPSLAGGETIGL